MYNVAITSDTKGKLKKIIDGVVYSDPLVFITELLQNSYRAKAKNVYIILEDDKLIFRDDGQGLKNPADLLVLDYSSWDSTDEGFGIGFWSVLAISELELIEVHSKGYIISINVSDMLKNEAPSAIVEKVDTCTSGFSVTLKSSYFLDNADKIKRRVHDDGQFLLFDIFFNGKKLEKKNLYEDVIGDFVKEYHNKLFDAKLAISRKSYTAPSIYYERRYVNYIPLCYVDGIIELRKGALNLKEPDRKSYVYDNKFKIFKDKLLQCAKDLYFSYLKTADESEINKYSLGIDEYLDIKEYERYLFVDDEIILQNISNGNMPELSDNICNVNTIKKLVNYIEKINNDAHTSLFDEKINKDDSAKLLTLLNKISDDEHVWIKSGVVSSCTNDYCINWTDKLSEEDLRNMETIVIGNIKYEKRKRAEFSYEEDDTIDVYNMSVTENIRSNKKIKLVNKIKKCRKAVWIDASELIELQDLKDLAEYYNIKIFVAKNVLYKNVYGKYNIPHISQLNEGINKISLKKNICLKTLKERYFINILAPICNYFNLPIDTFLIADLSQIVEVRLNDEVVSREVLVNKKNKIEIYGLCQDGKIYLDRKALGLNRFNFSSKKENLGINEFKAVFVNLNTIAHELAHLLYQTKDNTIEHFKKTEALEQEIANLLISF